MWCWPNGSLSRPAIAQPYGNFGVRPIGKGFHDGTDFIGFAINRSVGPGRVTRLLKWDGRPAATTRTQMGNVVIVDHGNGVESWHAHNSLFLVDVGSDVDGTTPLGIQGATGFADGPHDHLEIHINGRPVDPVVWLAGMIASPSGGGSTPFPVPSPPVRPRSKENDMSSFDITRPLFLHQNGMFVFIDAAARTYRFIPVGSWEYNLIKEEEDRRKAHVASLGREWEPSDSQWRALSNAQWEAAYGVNTPGGPFTEVKGRAA